MTFSSRNFLIISFVAAAFLLGDPSARAQSWDALGQQSSQALRSKDYARYVEILARQMKMKPPHPEEMCFVYWGSAGARGQYLGEMAKAEGEGTEGCPLCGCSS